MPPQVADPFADADALFATLDAQRRSTDPFAAADALFATLDAQRPSTTVVQGTVTAPQGLPALPRRRTDIQLPVETPRPVSTLPDIRGPIPPPVNPPQTVAGWLYEQAVTPPAPNAHLARTEPEFVKGAISGLSSVAGGVGGAAQAATDVGYFGARPGQTPAQNPVAAAVRGAGAGVSAADRAVQAAMAPAETLQGVVLERPELLTDPQWWQRQMGQAVGSMAGLAGSAAVGGAQAAALATVSESLSEAGSVYNDLVQAGTPNEEAAEKAGTVLAGNLALLGLTNTPLFQVAGNLLRRTLTSAAIEASQEVGQQAMSNVATGRPVAEGMVESAIVGGLAGGGFGAGHGAPGPVPVQPRVMAAEAAAPAPALREPTAIELHAILANAEAELEALVPKPQVSRPQVQVASPESQVPPTAPAPAPEVPRGTAPTAPPVAAVSPPSESVTVKPAVPVSPVSETPQAAVTPAPVAAPEPAQPPAPVTEPVPPVTEPVPAETPEPGPAAPESTPSAAEAPPKYVLPTFVTAQYQKPTLPVAPAPRVETETPSVAAPVAETKPSPPVATVRPSETGAGTADQPRLTKLFGKFRQVLAEVGDLRRAKPYKEIAQSVAGGNVADYIDEVHDSIEAVFADKLAETTSTWQDRPLVQQIEHANTLEVQLPRAHRSLEKTALQQFSTPLPIAVAAAHAAQVRAGDRVLEPTAGTGNLVAPVRTDAERTAMELAPRRAFLLTLQGIQTKAGDYLRALDLANSADVIITNPPWGKYTTGKYGSGVAVDFTPGDVAERFLAKNVRDLAPGGRLVAVMPTTMLGPTGGSFRQWLMTKGHVQAVIQSPPGAYKTRATDVESLLLVFDKVGATARFPTVLQPQTWEAYAEAVEGVAPRAARTAEQPAAGRPEPVSGPTRGARPTAKPSPPVRGPAAGREPVPAAEGQSGDRGVVPAGRDTDVVAAPAPARPARVEPGGTAPGPVVSARGEATHGLSPEQLDAFRRAEASEQFAPYRPRTGLPGVRHPRLIVEARNLAGVPYPELTYEPGARFKRILAAGRVSLEQAEQAVAALQANLVHHHGYLAADNVGVGKSREIALTILELMDVAKAAKQDLRLMVTTKGRDNVADLIDKELLDAVLGGEDPGFEIVRVADLPDSKMKPGKAEFDPLPQHPHAIYVIDKYNLADYLPALRAVGLHGVIGDEVHQFKNADAAVGAAWQKIHADIVQKVPRAQQTFAYFTATPAQNVYDYQYLYGLRLWPIDGFHEWVGVVTGQATEEAAKKMQAAADKGGYNLAQVTKSDAEVVVGGDSADTDATDKPRRRGIEDVFSSRLTPAEAEQIPREWKRLGRFSSRDLWRQGTEFVIHTATLPDAARARYDQFTTLARDIISAAEKFGRLNKGNRGLSMRLVRSQLQFAAKRMQMEPALHEAIAIAKEHVASGHQVVISLINVSEMDPEAGNIAAAIKSINVVKVEDLGGGELSDPEDIPEALVKRAELLEQAAALGKLGNPLDAVTDVFGKDKVAMVVGGGNVKLRQQQVAEFQAGTRTVAIVSSAGTTGISLDHRVETQGAAKGRRVWIDVQYEWSATEAIQRYGRVDRASQISAPKILPINFGSAAERKFLATIANRMASLGALSKGGAETTGAQALEEFEIGGTEALMAVRAAFDNAPYEMRALFAETGKNFRNSYGHPKRSATGMKMQEFQFALMFLPVEDANAFWKLFEESRETLRESMGYATERRAKAFRGTQIRQFTLTPTLELHQVKNEEGHRMAILAGVVMPEMPKIAPFLTEHGRRYITFTTPDGIIAGLEVPFARAHSIARTFGKAIEAEKLDTPQAVEAALKAGERLTLQHPGWSIRQRRDGRVAIYGAKMADRELLLKWGATYAPVGNYWHVVDLPKFLERFPVKGPYAQIQIEDEEEEGTSALPSGRGQFQLPAPPAGPQSGPRAKPPVSLAPSHILADFKRALDIPVNVGRFRGRFRGIFKHPSRAIRVRVAGDLITAFHEHGHDFDISLLKLRRNDPRWRDELVDLGQAASRPSYSKAKQRAEGAAEFFRLYVMDPAQAARRAPAYHAAFEEALEHEPAWKRVVLDARQRMQDYLQLSYAERGALRVSRETPKSAIRRWWDAARDPRGLVTTFLATHVDDYAWLHRAVSEMADGRPLPADEHAEKLATIARGSGEQALSFLTDGVYGKDLKKLSDGLQEILAPVADDLETFGNYLVALRAAELHQRGIETGLLDEEITALLDEVRTRPDRQRFSRAARGVYAFQQAVIDYALEYDGLNADAAQAMRAMNRYYVPFQRVMDAIDDLGRPVTAKRMADRRAPIYRIKGSGRDIIDPLESIIRNTMAMVDYVERNRAMQALTNLADRSARSAKWVETRIPPKNHPVHVNVLQALEEHDPDLAQAVLDLGLDPAAMATLWRPQVEAKPGERIHTVFRNGQLELVQFNHKGLEAAVTAMSPKLLGVLAEVVATPAKLLRAGATLTPQFIFRNLARDTVGAYVQSGYGFIPVVDTVRGAIEWAGGGKYFHAFQASGGMQSAMALADRNYQQHILREMTDEKTARRFLKHYVLNGIEGLRALSSAVELATRIGEAKLAIEAGGERRGVVKRLVQGKSRTAQEFERTGELPEAVRVEAALAGRRVTIDFQRAGWLGREINRYAAFYNARIGGLARMIEQTIEDPTGTLLRAGSLAVVSAILWAWNHDDEEYQNRPRWERDLFWHVPLGGGRYAKIPKPFEFGLLFSVTTERALDYVNEQDPRALDKLKATAAAQGWDIIGGALPTLFLPILENFFNYDTFRGRPIVAPYLIEQQVPNKLQYTDFTSELAKDLGGLLDYSPAKLDHLIYSYTAGLGRMAMEAVDPIFAPGQAVAQPRRRGWPVVGEAFVTAPEYGSQAEDLQDFVDEVKAMHAAETAVKEFEERGMRADYDTAVAEGKASRWYPRRDALRSAEKAMKGLRKRLTAIYDDAHATIEQKTEARARVYEEMVDLARQGLGKPPLKHRRTGALPVAPRR